MGIFKVTDPLGNVIYKNSGYDTDNFSAGDVIYGTNNVFSVSLPLVSSNIVEGIYIVSMKNQVGTPVVETELTQKYNFANPTATVDIGVTINIETPSILAEDNTVYGSGASVTRTWTVYYPASLALANVTGTAGSILLQAPTDIYTGNYEAKLDSNVTYTIAADATLGTAAHTMLVVWATIKKFSVDSSTLCAAYDCVKAMEAHYQTLKTSNASSAADFKPRLDHAIRLMTLILSGIQCGEDVSDLYADLKEEYDNCSCESDCGCDPTTNDVPTLISPAGDDLLVYQVTAGTGATVTPTSSGNLRSFEVALSPASTPTMSMTNGTPDELTIGDSSVGVNFAYTLSHKAPDPWVEVDSFSNAEYVKISSETYSGADCYPLRYRMERKYTRSDATSCALVRVQGQVRVNKTTGTLAGIFELFTLPGTSGTRYRPAGMEWANAKIMGGAIQDVQVMIDQAGSVEVLDQVDLSTLTPISSTYFILSIDVTFEGIAVP